MKTIASLLLIVTINGNAKCISERDWTTPDKKQHAIAGALIGYGVSVTTESWAYGFAAGSLVGVAKEIIDSRTGHTCSYQDAAVTALGAAFGAWGGVIVVTPRSITYARGF